MKRIHGGVLVLGLALFAGSAYAQAPPLPGQKPQDQSGQKKRETNPPSPLPGQKGQDENAPGEAGGLSVEVVNRIPAADRDNLKAYWPDVESKTKERWLHTLSGPSKSLADTQGEVKIVGWIHTDGSASGLVVEHTSGNKALDRAALRAITGSAPYDPFPYGIAVDEVKVRFTFDVSGGPPEPVKELPK
jgi:TonB family protein